VPNDQARDVPDISLAASGQHDGYLMYVKGVLTSVGGTSASSPSFAGIVSILNQYLAANGAISKPGLGNINPALYNLAKNTTGVFHDIVTGNNIVPCAAGSKACVNGSLGYDAGTGYDLATGLGSVDAFNLVTKWSSAPTITGTTITLTAAPATITASGSVQLNATLTVVSGSNAPAGSVVFARGTTPLGVATLAGAGATETAALTIKGANLAVGVNSITAVYAGSTSFSSSSAAVTVTVTVTTPPVSTSVAATASPTVITQGVSMVVTATVKQATGSGLPTGAVAFAAGNVSLGTANLVASARGALATLTVRGASLAVALNTITASYTATGNFSNSTGTVAVTVATPPVGTTTALTVASPSVGASGTAQITATVRALTGTTVPTGTVNFYAGNETLGTVPLSNGAVTLVVQARNLSIGSNSIIAAYGGNGSFTSSNSAPVTITVTTPVVTSIAVTASPVAFAQSSSTILTARVKAGSGSSGPAGSISFALYHQSYSAV